LADDIACEDRKETDQHLSGTPDSMIASQRTETEAGLEISTMAAGTKNQLASRLRVVDFVLLWAHDYPVFPPSFLLFKGTRFITERKSTVQP
jgi:hypothetical protein